jgi:hypothetical protein
VANEHRHRVSRVAVLDSVILAIACLITFMLVTDVLTRVYHLSRADDLIGGLWAVIATVFVFKDTYQHSVSAAVTRIAATGVSLVLCLAYLAFLPFRTWALPVLIGLSVLVVYLIGRPGDATTAAITTAVVLVASAVSPQHPWQQPILRLADTVIGVAVGVAAAWLGLRVTGQRAGAEHVTGTTRPLDGVPGGFGGVGPSRRGCPSEGAVGELVDRPFGVLLEPVVVAAFGAGVTAARPAARLIRGVVLDIALGGGPTADRAGGVPDLDQVLERDAGVVAAGLVPMVAGVGGQGLQGDDQVGPGSRGPQSPSAVPAGRAIPAGRAEDESGRSGSGALPVSLGFGPGAAVPDGVAVLVGDSHAPGRLRVARGRGGQVPG